MKYTNLLAILMAGVAVTQAGVIPAYKGSKDCTFQGQTQNCPPGHPAHVGKNITTVPSETMRPTVDHALAGATPSSTALAYKGSKDCTFQGQTQNCPPGHPAHVGKNVTAVPSETMRPTVDHALAAATPSSALAYKGSKDCTFQGQTQNCPPGHPAHIEREEPRASPSETMRPTVDHILTATTLPTELAYKGSKDCTFQGQTQNCPPGHPAHVDKNVTSVPSETMRPTVDHALAAATPSNTGAMVYKGSKDCTFQGQTQNCPPDHPAHVNKEEVRGEPSETMRPTIDHFIAAATSSSGPAYKGSKDCHFQGQSQNCPPGDEPRAANADEKPQSNPSKRDVSAEEIYDCVASAWANPDHCEEMAAQTNFFDVLSAEEITLCYALLSNEECVAEDERRQALFLDCDEEKGCGEPVVWQGNKEYRKWYYIRHHLQVPPELADVVTGMTENGGSDPLPVLSDGLFGPLDAEQFQVPPELVNVGFGNGDEVGEFQAALMLGLPIWKLDGWDPNVSPELADVEKGNTETL